MATTTTPETISLRHCIRCGVSDTETPFRTPQAMKCKACDKATEAERREYHKVYHKARGIAIGRLIDQYPNVYDRLFAAARREVEVEFAEKKRIAEEKKAERAKAKSQAA